MKIATDFDTCQIILEMDKGAVSISENIDSTTARAMAEQLLKSADVIDSYYVDKAMDGADV